MKKEEERSYALLFFIANIVLIFTFVWMAWDEFYTTRPWKNYQNMYYKLKLQKLMDDYKDELKAFQHPYIQQKYKEVQEGLNKAQEIFRSPVIQDEYKKKLKELRELDTKELSPLRFKGIVTRNEMMEEAYLYGKHKSEESKRKIKEFEKKGAEISAKMASIEARRKKVKERLDEFTRDIMMYNKRIGLYTKAVDNAREKYEKLRKKRPELQVHQVHLKDINKADRCMSCHVGINKEDSVSEEQPYAGHPSREVYLGNHPPESFGCMLCHEGQGRSNTDVEEAHGEVEFWLTPMYRGKAAQSSCIKCHDNSAELAGGEELWKGIRLFEDLGCYACHETEGFGKHKDRMIGPDLTGVGSKVNPDWLVSWIMGPKRFRPDAKMPNFRLEEEEAKAIASYLWQNSEGFESGGKEEFDDETIEEGAYIFESVGCLACHSDIEEEGMVHGPNLARIGEKVNYKYLVNWLLNPKALQPRTRMPNLRLDEEEARFLAAYLITLKSKGYEEKLTKEVGWLEDSKEAEKGERLLNRYGCFGCHKIAGMEGKDKIGVELSVIGSKEMSLFDFGLLEHKILGEVGLKHSVENVYKARHAWINAKLSDPRQFDEGRYRRPQDRLRMPDFRLNKDEVDALTTLLSGLRERELPDSYVKKMSEEEKYLAEGKRIVDKYNCMGCHQFTIDRLGLDDGSEIKGIVKLEEEDSLYFQLWEDNERLGRKAGETAKVKKKWFKNRIRSEGGNIASVIIDYHVEVEGRVAEEAKVFTPPLLYGEGSKVQFAWLYRFLNKPVSLRPWLDVRMPTFNFQPDEVASVVRYFATVDNEEYPYGFFKETYEGYIGKKEKETPGYLAKARNLFESKNVNCSSCHVRGDVTPEGGGPSDWAPDLSRASKRLKPGWIVRWLQNPQLIQPGTKMPRFFRKGAFQEIFPGTPEEQIESIKDLLMNFPLDMLIQKKPEKPDKSVKNELNNTIKKIKGS
ncbi:MAG: c-type cytochrome [Candidatus Scalinduaceae bacterium]